MILKMLKFSTLRLHVRLSTASEAGLALPGPPELLGPISSASV